MQAVIFTVAVILSAIGLSAIMNMIIESVMTVKPDCLSMSIFYADRDNFEMVVRYASQSEEQVIICTDVFDDETQAVCRKICNKYGCVYCDRSTLYLMINTILKERTL